MFRKKLLIFNIIISLLLVIPSCEVFEDGPFFSFKTVKERLVGEWELETIIVDDIENKSVSVLLDSAYIFNDDNTYLSTKTNFDIEKFSGFWKFIEEEQTFFLFENDTVNIEEYKINRLSQDDLWLISNDGEDADFHVIELRYEKKQ